MGYRKNYFKDELNKSKKGMYKCVGCGKMFSEKEITIDHILPQSCGGRHNLDNLQCMCRSCNSSKKASTANSIDDYIKNGKRRLNNSIKNVSKKDVNELDQVLEQGKSALFKWLKK